MWNCYLGHGSSGTERSGWIFFDRINLRMADTVSRKEIILADQRILCVNQCTADEFELLVVFKYKK
jgi:hypothetical protein